MNNFLLSEQINERKCEKNISGDFQFLNNSNFTKNQRSSIQEDLDRTITDEYDSDLEDMYEGGFGDSQISKDLNHLTQELCPNKRLPNGDLCSRKGFNHGRWSKEEHEKFIEAIIKYKSEWKKVQEHIQTRSSIQARSHAQKFFMKMNKSSSYNIKDLKDGDKIQVFLESLHNKGQTSKDEQESHSQKKSDVKHRIYDKKSIAKLENNKVKIMLGKEDIEKLSSEKITKKLLNKKQERCSTYSPIFKIEYQPKTDRSTKEPTGNVQNEKYFNQNHNNVINFVTINLCKNKAVKKKKTKEYFENLPNIQGEMPFTREKFSSELNLNKPNSQITPQMISMQQLSQQMQQMQYINMCNYRLAPKAQVFPETNYNTIPSPYYPNMTFGDFMYENYQSLYGINLEDVNIMNKDMIRMSDFSSNPIKKDDELSNMDLDKFFNF